MSKDISIIPFKPNAPELYGAVHGLHLDRKDYDRYELLDKKSISCTHPLYHNAIGEELTEDCYGDPLKVIQAEDFYNIYYNDNMTLWDKAIMAFVKALPADHPIMLFYS